MSEKLEERAWRIAERIDVNLHGVAAPDRIRRCILPILLEESK